MTPSEERPVDPRDDPAPFAATVILTALAAALVIAITRLLPEDGAYGKFLLLGPFGLVFFEIISNEVWWRRWWGLIPGTIVGLIVYFEGRAALADVLGDAWAEPVAYVTAWTALAAVFAYASHWPRTDFSAAGDAGDGPPGETGSVTR